MIIGAAGIGGAKEAESNLNYLRENNLGAAEVSFTHSTYLKKEDAIRIGKIAEKLNIKLSIHGSYYINLNAIEKEKITKSKERILKACQIGEYLKATHLVFHPGYCTHHLQMNQNRYVFLSMHINPEIQHYAQLKIKCNP